jgi:hypothetical protein
LVGVCVCVFCGIGVEVEMGENFKGARWIQRGQHPATRWGGLFLIFNFFFLGRFWIPFRPFGCLLVGGQRQSAWPGPPRTWELAPWAVVIVRVIYAYSDFLARNLRPKYVRQIVPGHKYN